MVWWRCSFANDEEDDTVLLSCAVTLDTTKENTDDNNNIIIIECVSWKNSMHGPSTGDEESVVSETVESGELERGTKKTLAISRAILSNPS